MSPALILEGLVAVLLVITVVYCAVLDRRLRALRAGQDGLKALIEGLDAATQRAQAGIGDLKTAAASAADRLAPEIAKARALSDELALMIETANRLADRLEGSRERPPREVAPAKAVVKTGEGAAPRVPADWEETLLKALREAR